MSEAQHLADAFRDLLTGRANGVFASLETATADLTAAQAAASPGPRFNSVWAIVNHVWFWQETLLRLLREQDAPHAELGAPDHSGWPPAGEASDEAGWQAARARVFACNRELADGIASLSDEALAQPLYKWNAPKYKAAQDIIAHNCYHTCEVISMRHMLGLWMERT